MGNSLLCGLIFLSLQTGASSEESCGATIKVSAIEGGEVTLPVKELEIRIISWRRENERTYIAGTEPEKIILIQDGPYKGRLNVTTGGSLKMTKLNREDQGVYRAEILRRTLSQCVQLYDLKLGGAEEMTDYKAMGVVRLILSACVFLMAGCVFIHHLIYEVLRRDRRNDDAV